MEHVGVGVDAERAARPATTGSPPRRPSSTAAIQEDAGEEFNVNSTPQLRDDPLRQARPRPRSKKTKTGYSTDAASLEKLRGPAPDHRAPAALPRGREAALHLRRGPARRGRRRRPHPRHVQPDRRPHRPAVVGRAEPAQHPGALRGGPARSARRSCPAPGFELLVADYNQIELRCIAHLAEDPGLIEAFTAGDDIHTATAARVFDVEPADGDAATSGPRRRWSPTAWPTAWRPTGSASGSTSRPAEAAEILDAYFVAFPTVKAYMERTVAEARERGYTETLFGRRRPIPELASRNRRIRQAGERQAMNAGIQGLAADIFKVALVRLDQALERAAAAAAASSSRSTTRSSSRCPRSTTP